MMDYINAVIFGIVQGLTEFLPVSSSGHLVILHKYVSLPINNELVFDVILHLSTILAVILFFRKDIVLLFNSWLKSFVGENDEQSKLAWYIILATIPAGIFGYFFDEYIEQKLRSIFVVIFMLIFVAIIFIIIEKLSPKNKSLKDINIKNALFIGFAQALALIPGTSRSGITIITGLGAGLKRREAIRFSFLLSIPVILGAFITKIPQVIAVDLGGEESIILLLSFTASFVSGILAIKYFLHFSKNFSLNIFAYYRILLAIVLLLFFYFG